MESNSANEFGGYHRLQVVVYHLSLVYRPTEEENEDIVEFIQDINLNEFLNEKILESNTKDCSGEKVVNEIQSILLEEIDRHNKIARDDIFEPYYLWLDYINYAYISPKISHKEIMVEYKNEIESQIISDIYHSVNQYDDVSIVMFCVDVLKKNHPISIMYPYGNPDA